MKPSRALVAATLFSLSGSWEAWAQGRIVETAPGSRTAGGTNALNSAAPDAYRGGGVLDRLLRPATPPSVTFDIPLPSTGSKRQIDPAALKRWREEQDRKRNWVVESAARMNRGETTFDAEDRREGDRRSNANLRPLNSVELGLQAVDSKYAREYQAQRNGTGKSEPKDSRLEPQYRRRDSKDRGESSADTSANDPNDSNDSKDPSRRLPGSNRNDSTGLGEAAAAGSKDDSKDSILGSGRSTAEEGGLGRGILAGIREGKVESALREVTNPLGLPASSAELKSGEFEILQKERQQEFDRFFGDDSSGSPVGLDEGFVSFSRGRRQQDFREMIGTATPGTASLPSRLGGEASLGPGSRGVVTTPFGGTALGGGAGIPTTSGNRDFNLGSGAALPSGNLGSTPALLATPQPSRLAPRPAILPIPIRGQGGF